MNSPEPNDPASPTPTPTRSWLIYLPLVAAFSSGALLAFALDFEMAGKTAHAVVNGGIGLLGIVAAIRLQRS
jgi:hypothetical protein